MNKKYKLLLGIAILLIAIRIIVPYAALRYANWTLANMKGYYGHIQDIDLSLYRGDCIIRNIYLNKIDTVSGRPIPIFKSRTIDLSIEWRSLFKGLLAGELVFDTPELIFTKDKFEINDILKYAPDFRKLLRDFMPVYVNHLEVKKGIIRYIDKSSKPEINISLNYIHIMALNLSSVVNNKIELPSTISAQGSVCGGTLDFNMKMNAMSPKAALDMNAEIKEVQLALLNDFLKAYGNFDVEKGKLGLYVEMAMKDGNFIGYIKPEITDLEVIGPKDRKDSIFNKLWENIIGSAGVIFKNQKEDQAASKILMEGSLKDPQVNTLNAVWEVLRNAFIQALLPRIDNEINIHSVETVKPGKQ